MLNKKSKLRTLMILLIVVMFLIIINLTSSVDVSSVQVTPTNATTIDDLSCSFTVIGQTEYNVTWYNNSNLFNSSINETSPWALPSIYTTKGEIWNCTIIAINSTSSDVDSAIVTIQNSAPSDPYVTNTTGQDIGVYEPITEGQNYTFNVISIDADGDPLTYEMTIKVGNDYCSINSNNGVITCLATQEPNTSVNDRYRILVDDGDKLSGLFIEFNVTPVNDQPYFSTSIIDTQINENETLQYSVTVDDEENSAGPFTFTVNSSFNPEQLEYTTSDNITFIIQFLGNRTSNYSDVGNWSVTIEACDPVNSSLCVTDSFDLEVVTINHAPTIYPIQNESGTQNQNFTLYMNASDIDETDTLQFSVSALDCDLPDPWSITTINNSNNATGLINITLNNSHVVCRNITISVTDSKASDSQNVYLNLTNVNDAPIIQNFSYYIGNTQGNTDIRNLTAYTDVQFTYKINGTDVDELTYESEILTYSDNSSLCGSNCPDLNLNSSSGIVAFTPNSSFLGNFTYEINLTDDEGLFSRAILFLEVLNNSPPMFNPALENQTANESELFFYDVNATDEQNDSISFSDDTSLFDILNNGSISFVPNCADIGNYTITITITDDKGAQNQNNFILEITNKPDSPELPIVNNVTIIEEFPYYLDIGSSTTDSDIDCNQTESLNYSSEFLNNNTILFVINDTTGIISFTPNLTSEGSYLINISVLDNYGLSDFLLWNLTILNRSMPPVIRNITPYGYPTNFSWIDVAILGSNYTNINISENVTVLFDHNSTDPDNDPLVFNWTIDGIVVATTKSLNREWGFSSNGTHNVTLTVFDNISGTLANSVRFSWNISIENLNRPPLINDSLPNITLNGTLTIGNYLTGIGWGEIRFNDPDNDTLTYNNTPTTKLTVSISGDDVTFSASELGIDSVIFTAFDPSGASVISNNVTINITQIAEPEEVPVPQPTSSKSRKSSSIVPFIVIEEVEREKKVYLDIIVPEPITIYKNNTIREILSIVNSGNTTLRGIFLSAETNNTKIELSFSNEFFAELLPGETKKTDLIITSYRLLSHYEIIIWANVTDPLYTDKAVIFVNSIERSRGNQSVTATKIAFAQDLLSSNPECIELNEFLKKARDYMDKRDYDKASEIIDSVIQGCKYLVSQSKLKDERPTGLVFGVDLNSIPYLRPILIAFAIIIVVAIVLTIRLRKANVETEE